MIYVTFSCTTTWTRGHGWRTIATVNEGICLSSMTINTPDGTIVTRLNRDALSDTWQGSTTDELREAGFLCTGQTAIYTDASGNRYEKFIDGGWMRVVIGADDMEDYEEVDQVEEDCL